MIVIVLSLILAVVLFVLLGLQKEMYSDGGRVRERLGWKMKPRQLLCLLALILVVIPCIATVPTGHTGIVTTFGKVEDYTFEAGVHLKAPWQEVVVMDNRNQKGALTLSCFSSDIQEVEITYSINYQIDKSNAQNIYRTIGTRYYDTVMTPRIQEAVKSVIAQFTADQLIENRNHISEMILEILETDLATYNIEVVSTAVEDIEFQEAFSNAVEAKQVAAQNKLQAEIEQAQATMEESAAAERAIIAANAEAQKEEIAAEAEAKIKIVEATAEADAQKLAADASEYVGQKQALVNQMLAETMTEELLKYYYVEGWDGELPETYVGSENFLAMMDIAASGESSD